MFPYDGDDSSCEDEQMDTIDLTASSPEPSPRPYALPHQSRVAPGTQQTRPTGFVKAETNSGPEAASRIDHVYRIIQSSDARAIQDVLFSLCKISPALCGAVARGLAPHSTYAQNVIRGARKNTTPVPTNRPTGIKAEQRAGPAYRRQSQNFILKREGSPARNKPLHDSRRENARSPTNPVSIGLSAKGTPVKSVLNLDDSSSEELLELPSIPKSVKKERAPSLAGSDHSSSTAFSDGPPVIRRTTTATSLPLHSPNANAINTLSNTSNDSKPAQRNSKDQAPSPIKAEPALTAQPLFEQPSGSSEESPGPQSRICRNCNQAINHTTPDVCYYHPGHRRRALPGGGPGSLRFDCCQQGVLSRGCESGRHSTKSTSQIRIRAPPSLSPTSQRPLKAPRLR